MLPLHTRANIQGQPRRACFKVIELHEFLRSKYDARDCALWVDGSEALRQSRALEDVRWGAALLAPTRNASAALDGALHVRSDCCTISDLRLPQVVAPGDVIALNEHSHSISVLYRRASRSNSILVTERCNSYCVMCSQPPIDRDDSYRMESILASVPLMDRDLAEIGITGGEPTLLGDELARLLSTLRTELPTTNIHVLTNGRRFADAEFAARIGAAASSNVTWGIPVYSDAPEIHDFVVQRTGAFAETLHGLMNLAKLDQHVEIRVVLQKAVVPRIRQLAHFIARNLTFVDHVAWMGLEPMGFARPNWQGIWVDPEDYAEGLREAIYCLDNRRMTTSIYNVPLCVLPPDLRRFAARSISDWKNTYLPACDDCTLRDACCGFFASAGPEHMPRSIRPMREGS